MRNPLYSAYERRLVRQLNRDAVPRHVGMIVDGNRRFAKARGRNADDGHRAGAANIAGAYLGARMAVAKGSRPMNTIACAAVTCWSATAWSRSSTWS